MNLKQSHLIQKKMKKLKNVHPGEILKLDFLDEMKISPYALAKGIGVDQTRITAACPDLSELL